MEKRVQIVKGSTNHATALSHKARQAVIWKPFPQIRLLPTSYKWAGVLINRDVPGTSQKRRQDNQTDSPSLDDLINLLEQ